MEYSPGPPPLFKLGPSALARFIVFVAIALGMLVSDVRYRTLEKLREVIGVGLYPLQRAALLPREAVLNLADLLFASARLRSENQMLKARNLSLGLQANAAMQLAAENAHLRELLQLAPRVEVNSIPAEILYDAQDPFVQKVVINRGSRHGIRIGAPAVNEEGLLGQVTRLYPMHAEVTLLTDKDEVVPVQFVRTGMRSLIYGISRSDVLNMRFVPINADVQPGDKLVTSGLDGIFPPGLPVAKVIQISRRAGAEFAQVVCMPVTPMHGARQLLVLNYKDLASEHEHVGLYP